MSTLVHSNDYRKVIVEAYERREHGEMELTATVLLTIDGQDFILERHEGIWAWLTIVFGVWIPRRRVTMVALLNALHAGRL